MITGRQFNVTVLRKHVFLATLTAVALRLTFVLRATLPSGDSLLYLQLAHNWIDHLVYGIWRNGQLISADIRLPGYPAFLAAVALLFGRSMRAIALSQVLVDVATCLIAAGVAAALADGPSRARAGLAALWLAATCPFVANYTAAVLTETVTAFLTMAALLAFVLGLKSDKTQFFFGGRYFVFLAAQCAFAGALLTGLATLMRPEMPLLLITAVIVYACRYAGSMRPRRLALCGVAMIVAFLVPLAPWAVRNFITLHELQLLAPRYATLPDEYAPVGYHSWTKTWLVRYRDVYLTVWKIGEEPIDIDDLPTRAFDSAEERDRVADLVDEYNSSANLDISPELDAKFAAIARERTARNPLRTYVWVPFQRALTIWFTPRTELLPINGKLWPVPENWEDSPGDYLATSVFALLNILYAALALGGLCVTIWMWRLRRDGKPPDADGANLWGIAMVVGYLAIRTAFLTTVEAPEPRYVVTCYPAVLALAALLWTRRQRGEDRLGRNFAGDRNDSIIRPQPVPDVS